MDTESLLKLLNEHDVRDVTDISVEEVLTKKLLIRQYVMETDIHPYYFCSFFPHEGKALHKTFLHNEEHH